MATTSLWRVKGYIGKLILYASNPEKTKENQSIETGNDDTDPEQALGDVISYAGRNEATESMEYVFGINCSVNDTKKDMMKIKHRFNKLGGVVAYHGYQSFAEGEVTPDIAFDIGKRLADELWGDEFQVLVTTHLDKESHIHNHFVINSVSFVDGKKYYDNKLDGKNDVCENEAELFEIIAHSKEQIKRLRERYVKLIESQTVEITRKYDVEDLEDITVACSNEDEYDKSPFVCEKEESEENDKIVTNDDENVTVEEAEVEDSF